MRVCYIEDAEQDGAIVVQWLRDAGFEVEWFRDAEQAVVSLRRQSYDLILLDWMLRGMDGEQVLSWAVNNLAVRTPVIFLTNVASEAQIAAILRQGADDYVVKPPRRLELMARIEAAARRNQPELATREQLDFAPYRIFPKQKRIERDGNAFTLTAKECDLAIFLFLNLGRLVSRDQLLRMIWGLNENVATRTLDTHVSKIRGKLGLTPENGFRIASVQNFGYRLERYGQDRN